MNPRKAYAHAMWLLPKGRDPNYVDEESKWKYIKRFSQNRHRQSICVMRKKLLTIAQKSLYPTCFVLISKEKGNREFKYIKSVINFSMRLLNMSLPILMPLGNKQMLAPQAKGYGCVSEMLCEDVFPSDWFHAFWQAIGPAEGGVKSSRLSQHGHCH